MKQQMDIQDTNKLPDTRNRLLESLEEDLDRFTNEMLIATKSIQKILHILMGIIMDNNSLYSRFTVAESSINVNIIDILQKNENIKYSVSEICRNIDNLIYETRVNVVEK